VRKQNKKQLDIKTRLRLSDWQGDGGEFWRDMTMKLMKEGVIRDERGFKAIVGWI
jgi:hypothetical protein